MTTLTATSARSRSATDVAVRRAPLAATGAAFAILVVVGNGIYTDDGNATLGYSIEFLGYVAIAVFLAWTASTFTATNRTAALLAIIGGSTMLAIKLSGWAAVMASQQDTLSPDVAAGLVQIDEFAFVSAWLPYGLLLIGVSLAARSAGRLPAPMAWLGVTLGAACVVAVPLSMTEPFVLPWLISLLWLIVMSTLLVRGRKHGDQTWSVEV
jgi:hypothetical protein